MGTGYARPIYLPDDLAEAVKDTGVPLSAVCQRALEQAVRRVTQMRELVSGPARAIDTPDSPLSFTARALGMLESAREAALSSGRSGHRSSAHTARRGRELARVRTFG